MCFVCIYAFSKNTPCRPYSFLSFTHSILTITIFNSGPGALRFVFTDLICRSDVRSSLQLYL